MTDSKWLRMTNTKCNEACGRIIHTHSWVLLSAIRDDLYMVSIHIVAEEIVEVRLRPLASKHVQVPVSLLEKTIVTMWRRPCLMIWSSRIIRTVITRYVPSRRLDSQCERACSVQCGTGHPLARHYMSLPSRGSTSRPGSGTHTGRWTEAPMSDCPPRCRYMWGCGRRMCRSCVFLSPCTSAGGGGQKT